MSILEKSNRVFYINFDQLDYYPIEDVGGSDFIICGLVKPTVIADGWEITNITEISEPDVDAIVIYDDTNKCAKIGILKSNIDEDSTYTLNISVEVYNATEDQTESFPIDVRVITLLGYITCPHEEYEPIWAIDFNKNGMQGEVINDDAILTSVTDIIMTPYGSRPNRYDYGSPVPMKPFATLSTFDGESMLDETLNQIERWEPRVITDRARSSLEIFPSRNALIISIPFFVPSQRKKVLYRKLIEE